MYAADTPERGAAPPPPAPPQIREKIRCYIQDSILLGCDAGLTDSGSLIEAGIIDSTGAIELVAFLEDAFAIVIADEELTPDNLDSIDRICRLVERKRASVS
jgi:acyl carrier protein